MTRFKPLLLVSALAALSLSAPLAQAQTGGVVPQAAEGSKTPPPPGQQPGAVTGSAADAPAVAGQADSQPVITPSQDRQPSQAQAMPVPAPASPAKPSANTLEMPESPTLRTPEPSTLR